MLQRQILKNLGNQIDIQYPICAKYTITSFHSIDWLLISVNVTIYRTAFAKWYQSSNSHRIMMITTKPRSSM
jgi:hypothetical protein